MTERPFEHQVAGHDGIVQLGNGSLSKPSTPIEIAFYKELQQYSRLRALTPAFHGSSTRTVDGKDRVCVSLENLLGSYQLPCVMDVKLGTRLYGDDASPEKKAHMEQQARSTTSGSTGLRICGIKTYSHLDKDWVVKGKDYGRSLSPETLSQGFHLFLQDTPAPKRVSLLRVWLQRVEALQVALAESHARVYGASLLLMFDAASSGSSSSSGSSGEGQGQGEGYGGGDARLIDFAHSHFALEGVDESCAVGLASLHSLLSSLLLESTQHGQVN